MPLIPIYQHMTSCTSSYYLPGQMKLIISRMLAMQDVCPDNHPWLTEIPAPNGGPGSGVQYLEISQMEVQ